MRNCTWAAGRVTDRSIIKHVLAVWNIQLSKRDIPIKDLNPSLKGLNITIPKKTVIKLTRILDDETNVTYIR